MAARKQRKAKLTKGEEVAHRIFGVGKFQFRSWLGYWVLFEHNKFSNTMTVIRDRKELRPLTRREKGERNGK